MKIRWLVIFEGEQRIVYARTATTPKQGTATNAGAETRTTRETAHSVERGPWCQLAHSVGHTARHQMMRMSPSTLCMRITFKT
jgi:hypothetical protein